MGHRDDRDVHARERADLARVHAARVDDDLGLDLAPVRLDGADATPLEPDPGDARARVDLGPAAPRALRERERQLARVDVAVGRQVRGAEDAIRGHRGEEPLSLRGRDQLEREAERLRPAGLAGDLLHALLGGREAERANLLPARLEPDLVLERPVQLDRAHHHLRQRERAPELTDEAGRVKRRAARQVGPLDEDDVVPPEPGEPVEDRRAAHTPADHDRSRPLAHGPGTLVRSGHSIRQRGADDDSAARNLRGISFRTGLERTGPLS